MCFCFSCLKRTILVALHFNYNLKRETKVDEGGNPILQVVWPKFKEGEATVREANVSANYGTVKKPVFLQTSNFVANKLCYNFIPNLNIRVIRFLKVIYTYTLYLFNDAMELPK